MTLRQFLKLSSYKLTKRPIPFSELSKKKSMRHNISKDIVSQAIPINKKQVEAVKDKISSIGKLM